MLLLCLLLRMWHISLRLNLEPPTMEGRVREEEGVGIATKSFVAATAAAAEANFRVIKWHSQMPAPPIVSWQLRAKTQTQLSPSSVAATFLPLSHLLALPHHAASARVKSNCSADKRMHMVSTGSPTLATGGGVCGATLVQQKAMANMINWALTLFMRPTPVEASLSLSRVSKPSLFMQRSLHLLAV